MTSFDLVSINARLAQPIPGTVVSTRQGPGGTKLAYIEGCEAIRTMNEIFGFEGWSSEIKQITQLPGTPGVAVLAQVRVVARGATRDDIGIGNGANNTAGFEMAYKEAVTDGLKRAMRQFGERTGNCLYDKDFTTGFTAPRRA